MSFGRCSNIPRRQQQYVYWVSFPISFEILGISRSSINLSHVNIFAPFKDETASSLNTESSEKYSLSIGWPLRIFQLRYQVGRMVDYRVPSRLQSEHLLGHGFQGKMTPKKFLQTLSFASEAWTVEEYMLHVLLQQSTGQARRAAVYCKQFCEVEIILPIFSRCSQLDVRDEMTGSTTFRVCISESLPLLCCRCPRFPGSGPKTIVHIFAPQPVDLCSFFC